MTIEDRAARAESLTAFDERSIPSGGVAPRSNIPDILARRALPAGRLSRLGATPDFHHGLLAGDASRPPDPVGAAHVLYVGSIFNRRHIPDLVRAFSVVSRAHPETTLDVVGDNRTYPRQNIADAIERAGLHGRVAWRQYITDGELATLYRRSRAFAFLSEYEGLGLTPLEALAAGIPAVLLDTPVARESCGEAALYAAKGDIPAIANALEQLLFDEGMRRRLLAAAPGVLGRYNWIDAAERTLAVLESSAAKRS
jgi:glycosyltransferase involved in cell wall biosynthesis